MGFSRFLVIAVLLFVAQLACADIVNPPPLRVVSFDSLKLPVGAPKKQVQWMLQRAMDHLYGRAFVDMGDTTDLMHGHLILRPKDRSENLELKTDVLEDLDQIATAQRADLVPVAILFHSREFEELRKGMPYVGPYGELDPMSRNWILFLVDQGKYRRGDFVNAQEFYHKPNGDVAFTVNPGDLPDSLFDFHIGAWNYAFYFYRTDCGASDQVANQDATNLTEVWNAVKSERVCLALTSFDCHNTPEHEQCQGPELPAFDIFKGWVPPAK